MVKRELYCITENDEKLYINYSTDGFYIVQIETSIKFKEAIDPEGAPYTYEETNEKIVEENIEENIEENN